MFYIFKLFSGSVAKLRPHEMSVADHLEIFRWHVIRAVISMLAFTVLCFVYMPDIYQLIIMAPTRPDFWTYKAMCIISSELCIDKIDMVLQNRTMAGQFTTHITSAFIGGIICAFPYIVWEIWTFVKPALYPGEVKMSFKTVIWMPVLFAMGIMFGYYIIAPLSINFLANYRLDPSITNQFDLSSYISTLLTLVIGSGLMFQLPVLIYFLSVIGIVNPELMSTYRKHAVVIIFVIAALLTPSPDMLSQALVAFPLYILYEISIYVSAHVHKHKVVREIIE